ncbi:MAG: glycosyltransferase [Candidatus Binatia bacterium]
MDGVAHFTESVIAARRALPYACTVVLVDDGSTDGTREALDRLHERHPEQITVIHLSRTLDNKRRSPPAWTTPRATPSYAWTQTCSIPPTLHPGAGREAGAGVRHRPGDAASGANGELVFMQVTAVIRRSSSTASPTQHRAEREADFACCRAG